MIWSCACGAAPGGRRGQLIRPFPRLALAERPRQSPVMPTQAEHLAPERIRYHPMARETIVTLLDVQRRMPEPLGGIATRMGLP